MSSSPSPSFFAMLGQRVLILTSSFASPHFTSSTFVSSSSSPPLSRRTVDQYELAARPDCVSICCSYATPYPRRRWHSRTTQYQPQPVSRIKLPIKYARILTRIMPCRFWSDILLMVSAIGQFTSSLITVMVRLSAPSFYPILTRS
jgi:hypothetical protein